MKKSVSIVLLATILPQSCVKEYSMNNCLSLDEALKKGKVKVVTTAGWEWEFKKIYVKDGIYIGREYFSNGEFEDKPLDRTQISCIYLKDKKSTWNEFWGENWILVVGIVGAVLLFTLIIIEKINQLK